VINTKKLWEDVGLLATLSVNGVDMGDSLFEPSSVMQINLEFDRESPAYDGRGTLKLR
jgi:hypothetical protein